VDAVAILLMMIASYSSFGMEAVKTILGEMADRPLAEISTALVAAARAHGTQIDDQTLLLIRRSL
jgi:serine phosphatase RsbU (regulator of sigma subunit)